MLKIIRPSFSIKEHLKAWAERKGYCVWEPLTRSDKMVVQIQKATIKQGWFWTSYTVYEDVLRYYYYETCPKAVAKEMQDEIPDIEGKKIYWFKAWPAYFNTVEVLAEEIESELVNKEDKLVIVTMKK